jgi:autotransporter-associated beta strand protein
VTSAHDPSTLIHEGNEYFYYADGQGINARTSFDMEHWSAGPPVFSTTPSWLATAVPGFTGYFWAPDVSYFGGQYHLYYAASTFGSQVSAIGMATNPTLNPNDLANYKWTDQGSVIQSNSSVPYNAIDPSILQDTNGSLWMSFGSYFSGIYLSQLDPNTGKPISSAVQQIAASSQVPGKSAIEASYLYHTDGYYYLFVNYGMCCMGVNSTYNVRVGRATSVNGPYLDQGGVDMRNAGGTLFLSTNGKYIGPGQVGIMQQGNNFWMSYHYYDGTNNGAATYAIQQLYWTDLGWPSLTQPAAMSLTWNNSGGSGDGSTWDAVNNQNWNYNGTTPATFNNGDNVTFNDTNNGHYAVVVNTTVTPASVAFNSSGNYNVGGSGTIGGTGSLTKSGTGTLTLSTANTYSGGTNVSGGRLLIDPTSSTSSALPGGGLIISGGVVQLADNVTAGSGGTTSNVVLNSVSISGNGTLDIGNNHIIINYGSGADPISSIAALLTSGYAGGSWAGSGITSSDVHSHFGYGVGYADAADAGNPAGLSSGQIEIKFTLLGDTNLDGVVNGVDFGVLAANFNRSVSRWDQGDFNYDNIVNGVDFGDLANNFNQGASSAADLAALQAFATANGLMADLPEPGLGMVVLGGLGAIGLRRRRTT